LGKKETYSATNYEGMLSDAFPHLQKHQVRQIAHLLRGNRRISSPEFRTALNLILDREDINDFEKFLSFLSRDQKKTAKKPGRPPSKVISEKYFQEELSRIARAYTQLLFVILEGSKFDISEKGKGFWIPKSFSSQYNLPYDSFAKYQKGRSSPTDLLRIDTIDFNFGAWWGMVLLANIVVPAVLDRVPELWSIKKHVGERMKVNEAKGIFLEKQVGFTTDMVEEFVSFKNRKLPIDLVKKNRKPKYSQKQIAKFTRTVKEMPRPIPQLVSKKMKLSVVEIMALFKEAVRQKKGMTLETTEKGKVFRVN
jgi:hypothetical protein